jgi:hypothetical protein
MPHELGLAQTEQEASVTEQFLAPTKATRPSGFLRSPGGFFVAPTKGFVSCRCSLSVIPSWQSRSSIAPGCRTGVSSSAAVAFCATGLLSCCGRWPTKFRKAVSHLLVRRLTLSSTVACWRRPSVDDGRELVGRMSANGKSIRSIAECCSLRIVHQLIQPPGATARTTLTQGRLTSTPRRSWRRNAPGIARRGHDSVPSRSGMRRKYYEGISEDVFAVSCRGTAAPCPPG